MSKQVSFELIKQILLPVWPITFGLLLILVPSYISMVFGVWSQSEQAHGPLVFLVVVYLFWDKRAALYEPGKPSPYISWLVFLFGLIAYILGRSQDVLILDLGSHILIISALILMFKGWNTLGKLWFPLFFMFFMIPLPGFFIDAVTMPMKIAVSQVAEHVLYWFDYPIARTGVILQIGQYQLLVADACAGMHTLISLEALGLLYLNLVKHDSFFRNVLLALLIIPISFTANSIRVIVITLVTYYFGDEVGQGFIHGFAGMFLFIIALLLIMSVDTFLQYISKSKH